MSRATWENEETIARETETAGDLSGIFRGVWKKLPFKYMADYAVCRMDKSVRSHVEIRWKNQHWPEAYIATAKVAVLLNFDATVLPVYLCVADPVMLRWGRVSDVFNPALPKHPVIWTGRNSERDDMDCESCFVVPDAMWKRLTRPAIRGPVYACDNDWPMIAGREKPMEMNQCPT